MSQSTLGAAWEPTPDFQHSHDWNATEMARAGLSGEEKKEKSLQVLNNYWKLAEYCIFKNKPDLTF